MAREIKERKPLQVMKLSRGRERQYKKQAGGTAAAAAACAWTPYASAWLSGSAAAALSILHELSSPCTMVSRALPPTRQERPGRGMSDGDGLKGRRARERRCCVHMHTILLQEKEGAACKRRLSSSPLVCFPSELSARRKGRALAN